MNKQYRQGDVFLQKVDKLPGNAKPKKDNIILRGEATGHAHRLENGQLYEAILEDQEIKTPDGYKFLGREQRMFVVAKKGTRIVHEEHGPIEIEIGIYIIVRQREYSKDENRFIMD